MPLNFVLAPTLPCKNRSDSFSAGIGLLWPAIVVEVRSDIGQLHNSEINRSSLQHFEKTFFILAGWLASHVCKQAGQRARDLAGQIFWVWPKGNDLQKQNSIKSKDEKREEESFND